MYIKGFDNNLCGHGGFKFEIGETYDTGCTENLSLCSNTVFHFCDSLERVHQFYNVANIENRYCVIEPLGEVVSDENKMGSNKIKIVREIVGEELDVLRGYKNGNTGIFNTGNRNTGDWNTGDRNTGDWNTGDWNTGYWNTGNRNTGDWNTGYRNTGDWNTGDWNTGYRNIGDRNTGDWNTGYRNTGDRNTGDWNTGDRNTGDWNTGNCNTGNCNTGDWNTCNNSNGVFCTKEPTIRIFNQETNMTLSEFRRSEYHYALCSRPFELTYIKDDELHARTFKEACALWWEKMSEENKRTIQSMPNFNAEIFYQITGIKL